MSIFIDQMHRTVEMPATPKLIISLVPSQTELLFNLGLDKEIIGITKFCIHPKEKVKQKVMIGGTKALNINKIKELKPDLIIGNKEENDRDQLEALMNYFPVWMSDITNLAGANDMICRVGELVGKNAEADILVKSISSKFDQLDIKAEGQRAAYLIWRKPYIIAGKNSFIDDMLQKCGLTNAFDAARYPEISAEDLIAARPDVVLLSSEPYPFKKKHIDEFRILLPNAVIKLVDGELFSWYGSRLQYAPNYFSRLVKELAPAQL